MGGALAQAMLAIDSTVMNVALPAMQAELGFADGARHWVITAYALTFGALLLPGSRVGARMGARRALMWGGTLFAVSSLAGGIAESFDVVIAARAAQGTAAALIAPASLTALGAAFPAGAARVRAFGIYGAVGVAGTAAGLLLGGPLTQLLFWRSPLLMLMILAAVVISGAGLTLPISTSSRPRSLPVRSAALSTAALFAVVLSLSSWESAGPAAALGLFAGGSLLSVLFARSESRGSDPLLPPILFSDRSRVGSLVVLGVGAAGLFSVSLFVVYFLQGPLGLDPIGSSLAILPFPVVAAASSIFAAPRLSRSMGTEGALASAALLAAGGMGWVAVGAHDPDYATSLLPGIVLAAAGMGAIFAMAPDAATIGLTAPDQDAGSSMVHVVQQVGGALGVAVLTSIASLVDTGTPSGVFPLVFTARGAVFLTAACTGALAFWLPIHRRDTRRTPA
ncbi:MFS transporter [Clavibacter sp. Sh2088]|uniref:MFS transporter n=1 Tax=Clavibacter sp. Sh2088 TaxID=3397676 RepID=UPI0039DFA900